MTAVTFPLRPPRLAFAICGWRWQNDVHEIKYSACETPVVYKLVDTCDFWFEFKSTQSTISSIH